MLHQPLHNRLKLGPFPNHDPAHKAKISVEGVGFWYGEKHALREISLDIFANEVIAFIGPSGCGKTTMLRCLNRTNEIIPETRMEGRILLDGLDIYDAELDPPLIRQRFGWIAQRPDPFPWSIQFNVLYGPRLQGLVKGRAAEQELLETSLRAVALWDDVKDRLGDSGSALSIGQQQRLCIARAIASTPEVLLMDEPCSALDPVATAVIEELIDRLRPNYTIVIITHNIQQAARVSQRVAYFHLGELVEIGDTKTVFLNPGTRRCHEFITGAFG